MSMITFRYFVKYKDIQKYGGEQLLSLYDNSLIKALCSNFPELKNSLSFIWFDEKPENGFWHKKENRVFIPALNLTFIRSNSLIF